MRHGGNVITGLMADHREAEELPALRGHAPGGPGRVRGFATGRGTS
jgi:hypothetical protein